MAEVEKQCLNAARSLKGRRSLTLTSSTMTLQIRALAICPGMASSFSLQIIRDKILVALTTVGIGLISS